MGWNGKRMEWGGMVRGWYEVGWDGIRREWNRVGCKNKQRYVIIIYT
jgi:hypothetical protein